MICLTEKSGSDIAAAGEKQVGRELGLLRDQSGVIGDCQSMQGIFIVLSIFTAAQDGYKRESGHGRLL